MTKPFEVETNIVAVDDLIRFLRTLDKNYKVGAGWDGAVSKFDSVEVYPDSNLVVLIADEFGSLPLNEMQFYEYELEREKETVTKEKS